MPKLICSSVVAPLNALGIKARYYDVDENLQPRLDTATIDMRTKAILGINYFGFPHDAESIADFCARHGLYYIEDNAHGFLSSTSRPLGTFGDIAIFSQRKTIPLPNGAALLINRRELIEDYQTTPDRLEMLRKTSISRFLLRNLASNFGLYAGIDITSLLRKFRSSHITDEENDLTPNLETYSNLTDWILRRVDTDREKETRRQRFMFWVELARNRSSRAIRPMFREMPAGVVPWAFPLRVSRRPAFIDLLRRKGTYCFPWPESLPSTAPRTRLSEELVLIPTSHQPTRILHEIS
jgi:hypothetical protein